MRAYDFVCTRGAVALKRSVGVTAGLVATLAVSSSAATASPMTVETYLEKVEALRARGPLGAFSSDTRLLQGEAQASFTEWLRQAHAPNACPPKGSRWSADPQRFLAMLRAVPTAERSRISVREVFRRDWNSRYPCA
jgi:hypothetical protein